ncbi:MAG: hypothetical protein HUK08_05140 [Bacteroidaceae bacterium]|nr:hypothetical protein [Bacteroidaceae bacterium]
MKKILISLFALFACSLTTYASSQEDWYEKNSKLGVNLNRSFKMAGGTDIVCFAKALSKYLPIDMSDRESATVDKANGYICYGGEGSGGYKVNYAVWKCSDGKRMYVVSYRISDWYAPKKMESRKQTGTHLRVVYNYGNGSSQDNFLTVWSGYQAYIYNPTTKMLEPIKFPVDKMKQPKKGAAESYFLNLPQRGKDIEVIMSIVNEDRDESFKLKWNGKNGFNCQ